MGYNWDSLVNDQAVGLGRSELTPLESETAARILGSNPYIRVSFLDEGGSLSQGTGGDHNWDGVARCTRSHRGSGLESKRAIGDDQNDTRD